MAERIEMTGKVEIRLEHLDRERKESDDSRWHN